MCLAAPSRVLEVRDGIALTECFGQQREVSLLLLNEDVAVGDYLLIQAGGFAFERVEPERAEESLALMAELIEHPEAVRPLGNFREPADS
jgi:hydrogenase expression/formation protein HypC